MTGMARDEFLRRYATSPIHVPRLERFLAVYGDDGDDEAFCSRFITWDRASPDGEAARIVAEILSAGDSSGRITRLSDDALKGAIRWMSDVTSLPVSQRARCLSEGLNAADGEVVASFVDFLAAGGALEAAQLDARARNWAFRLTT
jgi:hypothetical protein